MFFDFILFLQYFVILPISAIVAMLLRNLNTYSITSVRLDYPALSYLELRLSRPRHIYYDIMIENVYIS